jgi:4-amino-4-deoxy-L-arabinose transferase-like glycosyltransferase
MKIKLTKTLIVVLPQDMVTVITITFAVYLTILAIDLLPWMYIPVGLSGALLMWARDKLNKWESCSILYFLCSLFGPIFLFASLVEWHFDTRWQT